MSGSNDNMARLWDIRQEKTISKLKGHRGAVKAIAWCPWKRGVLATGGGCMDRSVKIWDTSST